MTCDGIAQLCWLNTARVSQLQKSELPVASRVSSDLDGTELAEGSDGDTPPPEISRCQVMSQAGYRAGLLSLLTCPAGPYSIRTLP